MSVEQPSLVLRMIHPESHRARAASVLGEVAVIVAGAWTLHHVPLGPLSRRVRLVGAATILFGVVYKVDRWALAAKKTIVAAERKRIEEEITLPAAAGIENSATKYSGNAKHVKPLREKRVFQVGDRLSWRVLKALKPSRLVDEISGFEMAELLGFSDIVLQAKAETYSHELDWKTNFSQEYRVGWKTLADHFAGIEKGLRKGKDVSALCWLLADGVDLESLQRSIVLAIVLGTQKAGLGGYLLAETKINPVGFDQIMPESNDRRPYVNLIGVKMTRTLVGEAYSDIHFREMVAEDVAPILCSLAGLPKAAEPFSNGVIRGVLDNLNIDVLRQYHQEKNRYSQPAIDAQVGRVEKIRQLLEAELKKPEISLSPRGLMEAFVGDHPTCKSLSHLKPFFRFQLVGWMPSGFESGWITERMIQLYKIQQAVSALGRGSKFVEIAFPEWLMSRPDFAAVAVGGQAKILANLQTLWEQKIPSLLG